DELEWHGSVATLTGAAPDLLIAYLGDGHVFVETTFDGALLTPWAHLVLRATWATHTGFFAAKKLALDAKSKVQYRIPLAVVGAANPPGALCRELLAGNVPELDIGNYCKICASRADTDRDGVNDCVDGCPSDARKTNPGPCGCGPTESDADSGGVPDCVGQRPRRPAQH